MLLSYLQPFVPPPSTPLLFCGGGGEGEEEGGAKLGQSVLPLFPHSATLRVRSTTTITVHTVGTVESGVCKRRTHNKSQSISLDSFLLPAFSLVDFSFRERDKYRIPLSRYVPYRITVVYRHCLAHRCPVARRAMAAGTSSAPAAQGAKSSAAPAPSSAVTSSSRACAPLQGRLLQRPSSVFPSVQASLEKYETWSLVAGVSNPPSPFLPFTGILFPHLSIHPSTHSSPSSPLLSPRTVK